MASTSRGYLGATHFVARIAPMANYQPVLDLQEMLNPN